MDLDAGGEASGDKSPGRGDPSLPLFGRAPYNYSTQMRYEPPALDESEASPTDNAGSGSRAGSSSLICGSGAAAQGGPAVGIDMNSSNTNDGGTFTVRFGGSSGSGGNSASGDAAMRRHPLAASPAPRTPAQPPALPDASRTVITTNAATPGRNTQTMGATNAQPVADSAAAVQIDSSEALMTPPFAFSRGVSPTLPMHSLDHDAQVDHALHAFESNTGGIDSVNMYHAQHAMHRVSDTAASQQMLMASSASAQVDADASTYLPSMIEDPDDGTSNSEGEAPASIQFEMRPDFNAGGGVGRNAVHELGPYRQETRPLLGGGAMGAVGAAAIGFGLGLGRPRITSLAARDEFLARRQHQQQQHQQYQQPGIPRRLRVISAPTDNNEDAGATGFGTISSPDTATPIAGRTDGIRRRTSNDDILSWHDVRNLDAFLTRLYQYYIGKGFKCIILASATNAASLSFVIILSTFMLSCVNYDMIHSKRRLSDIIEPNCFGSMSIWMLTTVIAFSIWWLLLVIRLIMDIPRLLEIQRFYTDVLRITDDELQTALWSEIVSRIIQSRAQHNQTHPTATLRRLDAHSIANRILRKENYMIALFNKDILNLSVPFLLGSRPIMTRLMEWNLSYCIFSLVFDDLGVFRKRFLREANRAKLAESLRQRFRTMAIVNLVLSPFLFIFLVVTSLFKYAEEYRSNPPGLGGRQYSPFAWWKFREFNELPHLLRARLNRSTESADMYIRQFPNESVVILAKFVSFVSGSLGAMLLALTLFEEELQQGFEITPGRSAFFYIGVFGTVLAISRGLVPPETQVREPDRWIRDIAMDTHYLPDEWRSHAHTLHVRSQFARLYDIKPVLLFQELVSVVLAPYVLYYSLPPCAVSIVDFFREFTVHVDSVGYVCSFAVFDFRRHGNVRFDAQGGAGVGPGDGPSGGGATRPDLMSRQGKMEHSFVNFKANYPDWDPGMDGSEYLGRLLARRQAARGYGQGRGGGVQPQASSMMSMPSDSAVMAGGARDGGAPVPLQNFYQYNNQQQHLHQQGIQPPMTSPLRRDFSASSMLPPSGDVNAPHQLHPSQDTPNTPEHHHTFTTMPNTDTVASYLRGESVIGASHIESPHRIDRELFKILDAVYEANRTAI